MPHLPMHLIAAAVALAAVILYADRTGWLMVHGTQTQWALLTRAGMALVLVTVAVAFVDLALTGAPFVWRHWAVLAALCLVVVGHIGLRGHTPT